MKHRFSLLLAGLALVVPFHAADDYQPAALRL